MSSTSGRVGRRGWVRLAILAVVVGAIFVAITSLYDAEGQLDQVGGVAEPSGLVGRLSPVAVDPTIDIATVRLALSAVGGAYVGEDGRLAQNLRVTVVTDTGVVEDRYPAGTVPAALMVEAGLDGEVAWYPFDDHVGTVRVVADEYVENADGSVRSVAPIPITLIGTGGVTGWTTTLAVPAHPAEDAAAAFAFTRAFSTRAFALLVLGLSVTLAVLSVVIGALTWLRRRAVEATLMSWSAALLFALPALRNFLPGSPPIGVALDVYVFLWVMVAAVCGAVLLALAWIDRDRAR